MLLRRSQKAPKEETRLPKSRIPIQTSQFENNSRINSQILNDAGALEALPPLPCDKETGTPKPKAGHSPTVCLSLLLCRCPME